MGEIVLHLDLFGGETPIPPQGPQRQDPDGRHAGTPGCGPEGRACETCDFLDWHDARSGRRYYKCALVPMTHGAGTDIRLADPACERYEADLGCSALAARTFQQILEGR